ncbi:alcohol dehydrogenase family protein [Thioalkalivibrio sp. HK1]|uniref:alcohol dehydrogenase family protein n=1 Tax=Thioalkalivibrio sp. HK1 TaxID=1469245 RepID=UPI0004BB4711|nr:alcohol dehydrogenase family protein [Thioalkalivibrio sp. HK1]
MSATTMRAMILTGHGGPDRLEIRDDWPKPEPSLGEVRVRVGACGLNNTDVNTRSGWYSKSVKGPTASDATRDPDAKKADGAWGGALAFPRIQGADVVGTVEAIGEGVDAALHGQRVLIDPWLRDWSDPHRRTGCGYLGSERDGGYAEFMVVDHRNAHPVRSDLTDAELATFPTVCTTAENMLERARVAQGDTVLITGASGGVGSALIQLVNRRGAKAIAICSQAKMSRVASVGARATLARPLGDLARALRDAIGESSVSVVADVVGGSDFPALVDALAPGGRYVCSGAIAGPIVEFDLRTLYLRDLEFLGATVPPPEHFADVVRHIEKGEVRPLLAATFALGDFHEAQAAFIAKDHVGNIVVVP